jgi:hypothetical protein
MLRGSGWSLESPLTPLLCWQCSSVARWCTSRRRVEQAGLRAFVEQMIARGCPVVGVGGSR